MTFLEQLQKLLADAKDDREVQAHLAGLSKPTTEGIVSFLGTEDGKKMLLPLIDKDVTKGIESFKKNNLEKLVEERYNAAHPPETEDQKKMRKLQEDFTKEKNERVRSELKTKLISEATSKKLPITMVDLLIGADEESSLKNLSTFAETFTAQLNAAVEQRLAGGGRGPDNGGGGAPPKTFTKEQMNDPNFVNANWADIQVAMKAGTIK